MSKGKPIPAKFDSPEEELLQDLHRKTGLSVSELIRRSVRLLGLEIKKRGEHWHAFLIQDLSSDRREPVEKKQAARGKRAA